MLKKTTLYNLILLLTTQYTSASDTGLIVFRGLDSTNKTFLGSRYKIDSIKYGDKTYEIMPEDLRKGPSFFAYELNLPYTDFNINKVTFNLSYDQPFSTIYYSGNTFIRKNNGSLKKPLNLTYKYSNDQTLEISTDLPLFSLSLRFRGIESLNEKDERDRFTQYIFNEDLFKKSNDKRLEKYLKDLRHENAKPFTKIVENDGRFTYEISLEDIFEHKRDGKKMTLSHINLFQLSYGECITINNNIIDNTFKNVNATNKIIFKKAPKKTTYKPSNISNILGRSKEILEGILREKNTDKKRKGEEEYSPHKRVKEPIQNEISIQQIIQNVPIGFEFVETPGNQNACSLYAFYGSAFPDDCHMYFRLSGKEIRTLAANKINETINQLNDEEIVRDSGLSQAIVYFGMEYPEFRGLDWEELKSKPKEIRLIIKHIMGALKESKGFEPHSLLVILSKVYGVSVNVHMANSTTPMSYNEHSDLRTVNLYFSNINHDPNPQTFNHYSALRARPTNQPFTNIEGWTDEMIESEVFVAPPQITEAIIEDKSPPQSYDDSDMDRFEIIPERENTPPTSPQASVQQITMPKTTLYQNDEKIRIANEIFLLSENITQDINMSPEQKIRIIENTLKYKDYLTSKQIARLCFQRAYNYSFKEKEEIKIMTALSIEDALTYIKEYNPRELSWLYYSKVYQKSLMNPSKEEILPVIREALNCRSSLNEDQITWLEKQLRYWKFK